MHSSTLYLVALASIMVTISSAAGIDQAKPSGSHIHHKRSMKKRLSPGNSGPKFSSPSSSNFAPASAASAGGLTDGLTGDLTGNLLGTAGGATGELPVVNGLI